MMARFKRCEVVDKTTVKKSGPFSRVKMTSEGNTICLNKTDIFGLREENTCVVTPSTVIKNGG